MPLFLPLTLPVDGRPIYRRLEDALRTAILEGRLRPGDRLPTIRQLGADLRVARTTVVTAYEQLAAEGYVVARVGSGTRVAGELPDTALRVPVRPVVRGRGRDRAMDGADSMTRVSSSAAATGARRRLPAVNDRLPEAPYYGVRPAPGRFPFDFRPGRPGFDLFPATLWERLLHGAWRDLASERRAGSLDYADPAGDPRLRTALAAYLRAARAVRCTPEQVVVTGGSQAAFDAAARLWLGPDRSSVVEDPGYLMARRSLLATGARLVSRLVDGHGLPTDRLPEGAAMVVVTPSWQYPLGGTMPVARRLELLDWARRNGALVVEDDYDSELRYEGHPLTSLQGLDEDGRVLYVGTLSKVAFPGLRLGYAVVPSRVLARYQAVVELGHRGPPALEQLALARFIEEGHLERHLRRARLAYAERQAALLDALRRALDGRLGAQSAPAGMHLVGRLEDATQSATELQRAARSVGVSLTTLAPHRIAPAPDRELLLGYTGMTPAEIREGVTRLARVVR